MQGMLGFFGTGGLPSTRSTTRSPYQGGTRPRPRLRAEPSEQPGRPGPGGPHRRAAACAPALRSVEASAYLRPTLPLVHYRLAGLRTDAEGRLRQDHHIVAKVSRTEVAEHFLRPAPEPLVRRLLDDGRITPEQAELGARLPLAQDLCVEADSAGHTDGGNAYVLMPAMRALRDRVTRAGLLRGERRARRRRGRHRHPRGRPRRPDPGRRLPRDQLHQPGAPWRPVPATRSGPAPGPRRARHRVRAAGDMFEVGATSSRQEEHLLPPPAPSCELYLRHDSSTDLDARTRATLENNYFKRSLDGCVGGDPRPPGRRSPARLAEVERSPKQKMAHVFRWYFVHSTRLAPARRRSRASTTRSTCGPALGAFNTWVRGTELEPWRGRRVDVIAERLLRETAALLSERLAAYGALARRHRRPPPTPRRLGDHMTSVYVFPGQGSSTRAWARSCSKY